ncbi:hypothetical protein PIB30_088064, partial [Stylosanthes scabra]|nr:hypothetical protein [Stylosanthes scabra]
FRSNRLWVFRDPLNVKISRRKVSIVPYVLSYVNYSLDDKKRTFVVSLVIGSLGIYGCSSVIVGLVVSFTPLFEMRTRCRFCFVGF